MQLPRTSRGTKALIGLGSILLVGFAAPVHAYPDSTLFGLPGRTTPDIGVYGFNVDYDASTDLLSLSGTPYFGYSHSPSQTPPVGYHSVYTSPFSITARIDDSGNLVQGDSANSFDLVISEFTGNSAPVLSGTITQFGFLQQSDTDGKFEIQFDITGGQLDFVNFDIGGIPVDLKEINDADWGNWDVDFSSTSFSNFMDISAMVSVPTPSTLAALSLGLIAVAAARRRRTIQA